MASDKTAGGRILSPRLRQLLASRAPVILLVTPERVRGRRAVEQLNGSHLRIEVRRWNVVDGFVDGEQIQDAAEALTHIRRRAAEDDNAKRIVVWLLEDAHCFLEDPQCNMLVKILHEEMPRTRHSLVLMGPAVTGLANGLDRLVEIVRLDLPDKGELTEHIDSVGRESDVVVSDDPAERERIADALSGLTEEQARLNIRRSLVLEGRPDADLLLQAKALTFREQGLLDLLVSDRTLDDVGGCDILRNWIGGRLKSMRPEGRKFIGRSSKGCLLIGPPGVGKTLVSKAVAGTAGLPLLRLDMGRMMGSLVGQSEERMRNALSTAEKAAPTVLQIDEIEKAVAGVGSGGDSGVASRLFGHLLTWLAENVAPIFVIATSNGIEGVPPELFRKGRFDDIFWLDLPTDDERADIFRIHVDKAAGTGCGISDSSEYDLTALAVLTDGFSGSEIEEVVTSALFDAFDQGSAIVVQGHLETAAKATAPMSRTAAERIGALRDWARSRARFASSGAARRLSGRTQAKVVDVSPALAGIIRLDDDGLN